MKRIKNKKIVSPCKNVTIFFFMTVNKSDQNSELKSKTVRSLSPIGATFAHFKF